MDAIKSVMKIGKSKVDAIHSTFKSKFLHGVNEVNTSTLHWAAAHGRLDIIHELLATDVDPTLKDECSKTPLHLAVANDHSDVALELLKNWSTLLINEQDKDGQTALHVAAESGNITILKKLVEYAADVDAKGCNSMTALHHAASKNHTAIVKYLTEGFQFEIEAGDAVGRTPLMFAASNGNRDMLLHLLALGADPNTRDHQGRAPIHFASMNGRTDILQSLLDYQVDMAICDENKNTALHWACINGHCSSVKYLIESGADVIIRNSNNQTPLDCAVHNSHSEAAEILLKDKSWRISMRARNQDGFTPMNMLIEKTPDAAKVVLDQCVLHSEHNQKDPKYEITFDYEFLDPGPYDAASKRRRYFAPSIMARFNREDLLSHGLTQSLMARKWKACAPLYFINVFVFMAYIIALTIYVNEDINATYGNSTKSYNISSTSSRGIEYLLLIVTLLQEGNSLAYAFFVVGFGSYYFMMKELASLFQEGFRYFLKWETYSYFLMISTLSCYLFKGILPPMLDMRMGYITCILTFMNFFMYLKRMYNVGIYIVMLQTVFNSVLKIAFLLVMFALLFSLVFQLTLGKVEGFTGPQTVMTVLAMAFGELGYRDTFMSTDNEYQIEVCVLFFCFLLIVPVTLINLTIGIAVGDIGKVGKDAFMTRLKLQIDHVYIMSTSFPKFMQNRFHEFEYRYRPNHPTGRLTAVFHRILGFQNDALMFCEKDKDTTTDLHNKVDVCMNTLNSVMNYQKEILSVLRYKGDVTLRSADEIPEKNEMSNDVMSLISSFERNGQTNKPEINI